MQTRNHANNGLQKPRRYYALCLGTIPKYKAIQIRKLFTSSSSCNVQFKLRGRGKRSRPKIKPSQYPGLVKDKRILCDLPLKNSQMVAVYVQMKPKLKIAEIAAIVRDRMLEAVK